ncbi:MAG: nuclear transport factor 2 family protein [Rhodospirillaceae bacterium]|nr:nuclear transport factor 2 family protein [Rhodospirillaceae bacterium]MDD9914543.1 nuclear transport factor 2 family protein [Rhodospirillaceae bacterium]MDD9924323.1 nuclear transport factor 2 family protein [Rhodospirillaceae bacterium]
MLNRNQLIELVEKRYFNVMDQGRLDDTLACLASDCVWHIYPAGKVLKGRDGEIRDAFANAMARYETMWHGNFEWTVDEAAQRVAASFDVRLVDNAGKETELSNVKLFQVEDGHFTRLDLYFSTTEAIVSDPN